MNEPQQYIKRPITITAVQWFKNGDDPDVGYWRYPPVDAITGNIMTAGGVNMGQMRHSAVPERFRREECHALMDDHGFIDTLEGGHTVCPADFVLTGIKGERYPCKPDIFADTYSQNPFEALNDMAAIIHPGNVKRGFWASTETAMASGNEDWARDANVVKLGLAASESHEAIEEIRSGHDYTETYYKPENPAKPEGVPSEVADGIIRYLDFCAFHRIDIGHAVDHKLNYNSTRPFMHGRKL